MVIRTMQVSFQSSQYNTGWYTDQSTGQLYYFNAGINQWYIYAAGLLTPLEVPKLSAPYIVDIVPGDTLRLTYSYKYAGPAVTVTEYASIGQTTLGIYDEKVNKSKIRSLPLSGSPTLFSGSTDIILPSSALSGWNDVEVKVFNGGKTLGVNYQNALNIVALTPVFSEFAIGSYVKV